MWLAFGRRVLGVCSACARHVFGMRVRREPSSAQHVHVHAHLHVDARVHVHVHVRVVCACLLERAVVEVLSELEPEVGVIDFGGD